MTLFWGNLEIKSEVRPYKIKREKELKLEGFQFK